MKTNLILCGLAAVQAILFFTLGSSSGGSEEGQDATVAATQPFLDLDESNVASITVTDDDGKKVEVRRTESTEPGKEWVLASAGDHPVKASAVGDLLGSLRKVSLGRVITRREAALTELQVSDARFSRHVLVKSKGGPTLVDLYLGHGKQPDTVVARMGGESTAWLASGVDTYEFSTSSSNWVDTLAFETTFEDVVKVEVRNEHGSFSVAKSERPVAPKPEDPPAGTTPENPEPADPAKPPVEPTDPAKPPTEPTEPVKPPTEPADPAKPTPEPADPGAPPATETVWVVTAEGQEPKDGDKTKVEGFVRGLSRIYMNEPAGVTEKPEFGFEAPAATVVLTLKDGATRTLTLGSVADKDGNRHLKTSVGPAISTVRSYTVTETFQKKPDALLPSPPGEKPKDEHDHEDH